MRLQAAINSARDPQAPHSSSACGIIDELRNGTISGWLFSIGGSATPILTVDGRPAELAEWPIPRDDVKTALRTNQNTGFLFRISELSPSSLVSLYALEGETLSLLSTKSFDESITDSSALKALSAAKRISDLPNAVAITCWDAAHNPVGRAKVLFDIATTQRPAIIIAYLFEEFGGKLWPPLKDSAIPMLLVPWKERDVYHALIDAMGIKFDTVWMCKPRYPTFEITAQISHPETNLILDFDDNEEHFSSSEGSRLKPYGMTRAGVSRWLTSKIQSRTVASLSLQEAFGGHMVRHARRQGPVELRNPDRTEPIIIGFIGTARNHKNLLQAAQAIALFAWRTKSKVIFRVLGDIQPESLRQQLVDEGAEVMGYVPSARLSEELRKLDVILTGFPSTCDDGVTRYQISSKIGDALSVSRPALVPYGPSVRDLHATPGIYLFDETNFDKTLVSALDSTRPPTLPSSFTIEGAYLAFSQAELQARSCAKAADVFKNFAGTGATGSSLESRPTLLLIWKQHDAGLYGRRIDQIARSYRIAQPNHRVIVLELLHEVQRGDRSKDSQNPLSDSDLILKMSESKARGQLLSDDGVDYQQILFSSSDKLPDLLTRFIAENKIAPNRSTLILFPIIPFAEKLLRIFSAFKIIVDVVDNQTSWANSKTKANILRQYVFMNQIADHIIFNAESTQSWFSQRLGYNIFNRPTTLIPNWYSLPCGRLPERSERSLSDFSAVYSGNMNDRIRWDLLAQAADLIGSKGHLHLMGSAQRSGEKFAKLIQKCNVVYHGPLPESAALRLISSSHVALMPHQKDKVSEFMNPLKLHMYEAAGTPIITTRVPGITVGESANISICDSEHDFLDALERHLLEWSFGSSRFSPPIPGPRPDEKRYLGIISDLMKDAGQLK